MLEYHITRIRFHCCKSISKSQLSTSITIAGIGIHFFVFYGHELSDKHYAVKLVGQILRILIVYLIIDVVNAFLAEFVLNVVLGLVLA